jgi:tRNA(Ile)-lysidine synthase
MATFFENSVSDFVKKIPAKTLAVAVSGGVDSMVLTHLLQKITRLCGKSIHAFHVNHHLRQTSTQEAFQVKNWLETIGIPCDILSWDHGGVYAKIQENARFARFNLLTQACREKGIIDLFLAHHKNDQLETFFMRLSKGSGLRGLCGMSEEKALHKEEQSLILHRPLLSYFREDIIQYAQSHNVAFLNDSSNDNEKYERVRYRHALSLLKEKGFCSLNAAQSIKHIQEAQNFHDFLLEDMKTKVCVEGGGLNKSALFSFHPYLQAHFIQKYLWALSNKPYPPNLEACRRVIQNIAQHKKSTLSGWLITPQKDLITFTKEDLR